MKSSGIAMLAGPIKAWWDENWNTADHWKYALWRERVNAELVKSYWLVYRPHEAFQGSWDERAQSINDFVLRTADVILNLTPPGVPSLGTDGEILYAKNFSKPVLDIPCPEKIEDFERALIEMNQKLTALDRSVEPTGQSYILASLIPKGKDPQEITDWLQTHKDRVKRFHFLNEWDNLEIVDTTNLMLQRAGIDRVLKIEVLR